MIKGTEISASGTRFYDDMERSWNAWWVLKPTRLSDQEIFRRLGAERFYVAPGYVFGDDPLIKRTRTRILVTQRGGYDI